MFYTDLVHLLPTAASLRWRTGALGKVCAPAVKVCKIRHKKVFVRMLHFKYLIHIKLIFVRFFK